jgi:AcrR family transcriptional regulator
VASAVSDIAPEKPGSHIPDDPASNEESTEDRRTELLSAAAQMFQQRGYSGTTMRDLAKEVGITSGSIFYHFRSKEDLLVSVVKTGLEEATVRIEAIETTDPRERLRDMIHAHLSALLGATPVTTTSSALFHEQWALSEEARKGLIEMRDAYEDVWDMALAALGPPLDDSSQRKLTRLLLMGAMNWSAQWYRPDGEFDVKGISATLCARFVDL